MSSPRFLSSMMLAAAVCAAPLAAQEKSAPVRQGGTTSAEARAEFATGWTDMFNAFPVGATQHFDQALKLDPNYGLARALRAYVAPITPAERQAELDRALADVVAAGASTQEVVNVVSWRTSNPAELRALLTALTTMAPESRPFALRLALTEPAGPARLKAMQDLAARFPNLPVAHNMMAYLLWDQGDHDDALREVQEYIKLMPDHPNPYDSYCELLTRAGKYPEARQQCAEALKRSADFSAGYVHLAHIDVLTGKLPEARAEWQQAIAHDPPPQQLNHVAAIVATYMVAGDRKRALETIEERMKTIGPTDLAIGHAFMAVVEGQFGNLAAARSHLAEARKGGADVPMLRNPLALAALYAGDLDAASATAHQPGPGGQTDPHGLLSMIASSKGDVATAQAELAQVSGAGVWLPKAFLAQALARSGKKAEARALRDEIMRSDVTVASLFARAKVQKL